MPETDVGAANADADADVVDVPRERLPGDHIVSASFAGTGAFVAAATAATIFPTPFARSVAYFDVGLFLIGVAMFLRAYWIAIQRSRADLMSITGVFFLAGTAPRVVRFRLLLSLAIEIVVSIVTASIRLYTPVAFGILVPMFGLGLAGLWGAKYGTFPPRQAAGD